MLITGTSYFGNRMLDHYLSDLKDMKEHHCNSVLHCFSENDYFFYKDSMKDIVAASHDAGLEVYIDPWAVGGVFGGEADWRWVPKNLETSQIRMDGKILGIACPNQPKFREFMKDWIRTALDTGADIAFWDEPHFYLPGWCGDPRDYWACRCNVCQEMYQAQFGEPLPLVKTPEVKQFQAESLYNFLREMCITVKEYKPHVRNCICLLPYRDTLETWERFASIPELDIIGTDPYWLWGGDPEEMVRFFSERIMECAGKHNKEGQIWIQGFKIVKGKEEEVSKAIQTAYDCGIRNICTWAYRACGQMSHLRCDDSPKVWDIIGSSYKNLHQKE